jgi:uncharacterized protein with HEPN domain
LRGLHPAELLKDWKLTAAFEREMQVLGEAVKGLPADLTARYPRIPWRQIAGICLNSTRPGLWCEVNRKVSR